MQAVIAVVFGLMVSSPVIAESLVEGWVRRSSGEPVEAAQVLVFDWTNLRRGAVARATTDAAGYFALSQASLGGLARPKAWTLGQNYPNPFNPSTLIPYQVPTAGRVRLELFNVLGQRVATLVDGERSGGRSHGGVGCYGCGGSSGGRRRVFLSAQQRGAADVDAAHGAA